MSYLLLGIILILQILILKNQIIMAKSQADEAADINALTERQKAIEAKIQVLVDAAKAAGTVDPALQTAVDNLAAEIGNTETEIG